MSAKKMGKSKKKPRFKILKFTLITILSIMIFVSVAAAGVVLAIIKSAPEIDVNSVLTLNEPSTLYNDKGDFMDIVITDEKRTVISYKEMPQDLKNAFVSIEDERFYKHNGIDIKRIGGATYTNIMKKIKKQPGLHGASTITQQLIKRTVLTPEITFKRKIQEMYMAIQLEKTLSKEQILEAYMNNIFLGGRAYGVEAAANQYFNKKASELSLVECAFIAGMPQSPSVNYPFSPSAKKDPSIYLNRTKMVLKKMLENKYISNDQFKSLMIEDPNSKDGLTLDSKKLGFVEPRVNVNKLNNEWFSLPVIESVKSDLKTQYNYTDLDVERLLMYGGLKIYSTMNAELQDATQKILNDDKNLGIKSEKDKNGIIQPQASATIMDYHTGEVKAIIGGRCPEQQPARSYNRAAFNGSKEFLRPAGSSIKPLTVYSASIDSQNATAGTVIDDSPISEQIIKKYDSSMTWVPRNYETGSFSGLVTIREAITRSINIVAIKLVDQIGLKKSAEYAEKFGLTLDNHDKTSITALSLGQLHHGTNTLTMAAAYGTFGNNGNYTKPILYTKVIDKTGKTILENKPSITKILSPQSAYIMYDLLKGPTQGNGGTAHSANFGNIDVRGKTGTSGDKKDFWFCGLTPYYSGSVWIGHDIPKETWNIYSSTSARLWSKMMSEAHKNLNNKELSAPSGVVTAPICKLSGKLPTDLCPKDMIYTEIFTEGSIPTELCDIHTQAEINNPTEELDEASTGKSDEPSTNTENDSNTKNAKDSVKTELDAVKEEDTDVNSKDKIDEIIKDSNTKNKQKNNNSSKDKTSKNKN